MKRSITSLFVTIFAIVLPKIASACATCSSQMEEFDMTGTIGVLFFMGSLMMLLVGWLVVKSFQSKTPWVSASGPEYDGEGEFRVPASKLGTITLLLVVTSIFSLIASAYYIRMSIGDWVPLNEPALLWQNTGILALSSFAIHWAQSASKKDHVKQVRTALIATGIFTFAFILGQIATWQLLYDQGYYAFTNPSYAFYYVLTGLHIVHLLGGLWFWGMSTIKALSNKTNIDDIKTSIECLTLYWHFLLLVWIGLFALLLAT